MMRVIDYKNPPSFLSHAAVGGREERQGPLGGAFDHIDESDLFGMDTYERAEAEMCRMALSLCLKRGGMSEAALSLLVAGDLQNQCMATSLGLYSFGVPYLGIYGACSTCTASLITLGMYLSERGEGMGACVTSSHNCTAEKQFRTPLEYGGQRSPSAQWTATAAASFVLGFGGPVVLRSYACGRVINSTVTDPGAMGAAMAPAAADTALAFFSEREMSPKGLDAVVTGDLGRVGSDLFLSLCDQGGVDLSGVHRDCGLLLYRGTGQDTHAGGSGCGCSASVLSTHFLPKLRTGELTRIFFMSTGALLNADSAKRADSILGVAHGLLIERWEQS